MGWWSDFRDNILKPVAGVALFTNVLGGGGNIFKGLFGGGGTASAANAGAQGIFTKAATSLGASSGGVAAANAATSGGLLGKGLAGTLGGGGGSALTTAMLMGAMGNKGVPKIETPQLDANSQALKNKLIDTTSSAVGQYQNAYSNFDPSTINAYLEDIKNKQERAQATGFKPISPAM